MECGFKARKEIEMGTEYQGGGTIVLKDGVTREQVERECHKSSVTGGIDLDFKKKNIVEYYFDGKRGASEFLEGMRKLAAERWCHYERLSSDDWRHAAQTCWYEPEE